MGIGTKKLRTIDKQ